MRIVTLLLVLFGSLSLECMQGDENYAPALPPEITFKIINNLFDKDFIDGNAVLKEIVNALQLLSTSKDFNRQKPFLIESLQNNISPELLDKALVQGVNKNAASAIDVLVAAGALLCREPNVESCTILMDAVKDKNVNKISLIMKVLNQMIKNNPALEISYGALNTPLTKAKMTGTGTRGYITLTQFLEPERFPPLISLLLKTNDLLFLKHFFQEANKYQLTELIKEVLLPTMSSPAALKDILHAPIIYQNFLFDQANTSGILKEMLETKIDAYKNLIPLTYAIVNLHKGYWMDEESVSLNTIENLLEQEKQVDNQQLFIPTNITGKDLNAQQLVDKFLEELFSIIKIDQSEGNIADALENQSIAEKYINVLNLIKKYQ